jgi:hypothetical protein
VKGRGADLDRLCLARSATSADVADGKARPPRFERGREEPERLTVADGWLAAVVAVGLIIIPCRWGDRATVTAID